MRLRIHHNLLILFVDIKDQEEFTKDDEFNLKTTFEDENFKDSKEILLKNNIFDPSRKIDILKPIREPKMLKRIRKEMREKTLGNKWGDMQKQDVNPELQNDLAILQLRKFLNPKSFFKSSENKNLPKYYQVGTIIEGGDDFVGGRLKKKEKKNSVIDLFLKEDGDLKFSRKRFLEIQKEKQKKSKNRQGSKFNKLKRLGKKMLTK